MIDPQSFHSGSHGHSPAGFVFGAISFAMMAAVHAAQAGIDWYVVIGLLSSGAMMINAVVSALRYRDERKGKGKSAAPHFERSR